MEEITYEQEMNLILDQSTKPVVGCGLAAKLDEQCHGGHAYLFDTIKTKRPDAKLIIKVFTDVRHVYWIARMHNAVWDPDTYAKIQRESNNAIQYEELQYDKAHILDFCAVNGVDYITFMDREWFEPFKDNEDMCAVATCAPAYGLTEPANFAEIQAQCDEIMETEEYHLGNNVIYIRILRGFLMAGLMGIPQYGIKASSYKDMWMTAARNHMAPKYCNMEYITTEPYIDTDLDIPLSSSRKDVYTKEEQKVIKDQVKEIKDKTKEPKLVLEPAFLEGKKFKYYEVILPNGNIVPVEKIE